MLLAQQTRGKDGFGAAIFDQNGILIQQSQHSKSLIHAKTAESLIDSINSYSLPDSSKNIENIIGHTLHSVVSLVPQPITKSGGVLVANCEIYNWRIIAGAEKIDAQNDADLLLAVLDKNSTKSTTGATTKRSLKHLNGVFAFAYINKGKLILARDIIGEKPLFFAQTKSRFYFASESKTLREVLGDESYLIEELNPRHILIVDIKTLKLKRTTRPFFEKQKETQTDEKKVIAKLSKMLVGCVKERLPAPSVKIGVLFSGGVDSTLIALILKKLGRPFTCYTAAFEEEGMGKSTDLAVAREAAEELGFKLTPIIQNLATAQQTIQTVIPLIESSNVVKVGVAMPFYLCCKQAALDNVRVMFSGLGSEELFAGYQRHKTAADINLECISGLRKMYERDLYRDDVVSMNNTVELRLPFLDLDLINFALKIPSGLKIKTQVANNVDNVQSKYILRQAALALGLPEKYALRPKQAAQYGSRFDKAIQKLADKGGFALKSAYLNTYFEPKNQRLGVLFSSGKDSMYALHTMQRQAYPISCLITLQSKNLDSYMFHTPAIEIAKLQASSINLPLIVQETKGEKEEELEDLKTAISSAIKKYHIDGIVTGALYSVYQRERIEKIAEELGIKVFSPLWHIDQEKELRQILDSGFSIILTQVAAEGLDASWLGREITHADVDKLVALNKKIGINIAGEGGEFESLVIDGPNFSKKIELVDTATTSEGAKHTLLIKEARLINKK